METPMRRWRVVRGVPCCLVWLLVVGSLYGSSSAIAQEIKRLDNGLNEYSAGRLKLITDLPIDDELRRWPDFLDQAIEQWLSFFSSKTWDRPHDGVTVYLMVDTQRFAQAGYLQGVPAFEDGYQYGNRLFLREQPSVYYRRHLFLHEGTHWITSELFGGGGSPWYMEGMADMFGTHRVDGTRLFLNSIPARADDVPYWGRLKLIHASLERKTAPSLTEILNFTSDGTTERMNRYAWSWAATVFFVHHPDYAPIIRQVADQPLDYSLRFSQEFRSRLADRWPTVVNDWNGFVTDLDFGYRFDRSMVATRESAKPLGSGSQTVSIDSAKGWQSTGVRIQAGQTVRLQASGSFSVVHREEGSQALEWRSEPQGLTLRYQNRYPIGRLIGSVVPDRPVDETTRWETLDVGRGVEYRSKIDGILYLKLNERAGELGDNRGVVTVQIWDVR